MTDRTARKTILKYGSALLVVIAAIALGLLIKKAELPTTKREAPRDFVVFSDVPPGIALGTGALSTRGRTTEVLSENSAFVLSDQQRANFYLPYHFEARLTGEDKNYDLAWDLDKDGVNYNVALAGFPAFTPVSVSMNGDVSTGSYGTDWSGRTVIGFLLNVTTVMNVCVTVMMSPPLKFCQTSFPQKGRTE